MNVISFTSPKGGAGKSTAALITATTLVDLGQRVALADLCPTDVLNRWSISRKEQGRDLPFTLVAGLNEDNFFDRVEDLRGSDDFDFLIVDTEGSAEKIILTVLSQTDLAIIPMNCSPIDAEQAVKAGSLVRRIARQYKRDIPYAFTLSRTSHIASRDKKHIIESLDKSGQPYLGAELFERAAFRDMYAERLTLPELVISAGDLEASTKTAATRKAKLIEQRQKAETNAKHYTASVVRFLAKSREIANAA